MYNLGDNGILDKIPVMSSEVYRATLVRIKEYQDRKSIKYVTIAYHGGEPLLVGKMRFEEFCSSAREILGPNATLAVQSNGLLIDDEWINLFSKYGVVVGLSIDGPPSLHDANRMDHSGRGSYYRALRGLRLLQHASDSGILSEPSVISVIDPRYSPLRYYEWVRDELKVRQFSILPPDANHDNFAKYYSFSLEELSIFVIGLFDKWWKSDDQVEIRIFRNLVGMLLGNSSETELLGSPGASTIVIDVDGEIQCHDVIRTCDAKWSSNLNVMSHGIENIFDLPIYQEVSNMHGNTCMQCNACPVYTYCKGGFISHRFSTQNRFENPSVYCRVWFKLILHSYLSVAAHQRKLPT